MGRVVKVTLVGVDVVGELLVRGQEAGFIVTSISGSRIVRYCIQAD